MRRSGGQETTAAVKLTRRRSGALVLAVLLAAGCASGGARTTSSTTPQGSATPATRDTSGGIGPQYASTYQRHPNPAVLIRNATIMTATGEEIQGGSILLRDGKIVAVGTTVEAPSDATVVDGTGKWVTPGVIDTHSHLGVYAAPGTFAESDGNEATRPVTAEVWAEHSFWPHDPQIPLAIAGGVTTIQALPGSANLIGGRSAVLKLVPGRSVQEMKFPGARYGLKMACGENPKRVYGQRGGPSTRMGNMAGYREAFIAAQNYQRRWDKWLKDRSGDAPDRNLRNETLADVLRGNILVQNHCYRADEMMQMLDLAREFGFKIRSFHHAVEAYKIADVLAREGVASSIWADWWGFKEEAMDGIYENAALLQQAGARAIIHSDDAGGIQRLNQEAAKAMYHGRRAGIPVTRDQALRWFTANPAWALGLDSIVGTLEPGKMADVVVWSADPLSVYAQALRVYNDGWLVYDRADPTHQPKTDFMLGRP
ncbi:MAG TPA: amidohydrolase family protein [Gemmatimonadales bacterium]|nr:amidohydrolase family protein [Gemmatimonadales bacterium]